MAERRGTGLEKDVARAVAAHLPGRQVLSVRDGGEWVRRRYLATLEGGGRILVKLSTHPEWLDAGRQEMEAARLMAAHGLPVAPVLAWDPTCRLLPYPFVIQEWRGGQRLGAALAEMEAAGAFPAERGRLYQTLGALYARMHAVAGPRSGVWDGTPERIFAVSPNDYLYRAEILEGSARRALDAGLLSPATYRRIVAAWARHLEELKAHRPSLVHGSPFPWTIYVECDAGGWRVAKLAALGDVLWWDPAYDVAFLRYPPYGATSAEDWAAFERGYGASPSLERRRLLLYALLQRPCAAMGTYMAPASPTSQAWAAHCLSVLPAWLDEIEGRA
jgi:hypothetical protein